MEEAEFRLMEFLNDGNALEPEGWNRGFMHTPQGQFDRRRPDLTKASEHLHDEDMPT